MAAKRDIKRPTMTARRARDVLQEILDERKMYASISVTQANAMHVAATILDQANADGASLIHEAGILWYHVHNIDAVLMCDAYTRNALKAAVFQLDRYIALREGGGNA